MRCRWQKESVRQLLSQLRLGQTRALAREDPDGRMIVDREAFIRSAIVERNAQEIWVVLEVRRQLEPQLAREKQAIVACGHGIAVRQFGDRLDQPLATDDDDIGASKALRQLVSFLLC